ncbi:hypothetical protein WA1_09945 [Scytonema hofmannii PCC 7110]|uniref:Uncharacterized protein n=1 Tax=Scytonema hofmannii PCC 7110 TaxID=128403 RepID=A0A139WRI7_9CYAN|nr:hypothetical protein [Scytonema hofmannii]KYC35048.1 hypothetical protein WA1_09945 [Scytonema hofmannii PCC 7110]
MKVNNQDLYYKTIPQVDENIEDVFAQHTGCISNLNSANTKSKKPALVARWYRENGKMVCQWESI